jgi:hypothetical protein
VWYYNEVGDKLNLPANIDGLPIFQSSSLNLWPILVKLGSFHPLLAAVFSGNSKPGNINEYLENFITKMRELQQHNLPHRDKVFTVRAVAYLCDAPCNVLRSVQLVQVGTIHVRGAKLKVCGIQNGECSIIRLDICMLRKQGKSSHNKST